ncbi:MAG TPA: glycine cleavage system aminomethyltransferase GcvT [Flavobacteriales bacterium]|nr:glycine cleavage system aminomethyltransferase GcvT [Flavobacteriales bacterium]
MKSTALTHVHEALGAKMVPFAGYNMPVSYAGIKEEHQAVRNSVGVFDVSHMGEFILKGERALELVQKITSNDASRLTEWKVQYSYFPNETGGIIDDLLVYKLDGDAYMLVVNASNIEKDWEWLVVNNTMGVELHNISDKTTLLAVQGPKAAEVLQGLTAIDLAEMKYYTSEKGVFAGAENVLISATGYTGAGGFELYFENEHAELIWNSIFEAGKARDIQPAGLGARDTLRLEMGFCLYGNDIDDSTSPLAAGLGWITKFSKEFINSANLLKEKENGTQRKLVGFELIERGIPRQDYMIVDGNGKEIGTVTSGTMSPSLNKAIGMGYIDVSSAVVDSEIFIVIRDKKVLSKVVKLPFYKSN